LERHDDFVREISKRDSELDVVRACLCISEDEYPGISRDAYIGKLQGIVQDARGRLEGNEGISERLSVLNDVIFNEYGFQGDSENYYSPENSYLNRVIDMRKGIPLTLSIIYMHVGRNMGLPLTGISFPSHFLVELSSPDSDMIIDPFNAGRTVSKGELTLILRKIFRNTEVSLDPFITASGNRQIILRLLMNLKSSYMRNQDFRRAVRALDWILLMEPDMPEAFRERGVLSRKLGNLLYAKHDIKRYLQLSASEEERKEAQRLLDEIENELSMFR